MRGPLTWETRQKTIDVDVDFDTVSLMATASTDIRRSRRRDDVRWFHDCSFRSLRSLGLFGALLIESGHPDLCAIGPLAVGAAGQPTPGTPNTSLTRI